MINLIKYQPFLPYTNKAQFLFSNSTHLPVNLHQHKYFKLINDLKDEQYVRHLIKEQTTIRSIVEGKYPHFSHLRNKINTILRVWRLLTWSQAYHPDLAIPNISPAITKIQTLTERAFSQQVNYTHENMEVQDSNRYEPVSFYLYFELAQKISPNMYEIYLNAYLHLLHQKWPMELLRSYQAIRQHQTEQLQQLILNKIEMIEKMVLPSEVLSQTQMCLFIGHYKSILSELSQNQRSNVKKRIQQYIWSDQNQDSIIHLENMIYCLYLGSTYLHMNRQLLEWLLFRFKNNNSTSIFLSTLYPHQDKLSCLKVDFWMEVSFLSQGKPETQHLYQIACNVILQLYALDYSTWRFRYAVWMFDSLVNYSNPFFGVPSQIVYSIARHPLAPHHTLSSFVSTFINYTSHRSIYQEILLLQTQIAKWLSSQKNQHLLSQPPTVLCQLLPHADRHPALHVIYLPYLQRLLQISLGQFEWSILNQLFYFGLKWKANSTEQGFWRMEYVRRYIMNEYSSMGIRRREIPQDSYFYKIHELTTPEQFYKNYIER